MRDTEKVNDINHKKYKWRMIFILPAWVLISFYLTQIVLGGLIWLFQETNIITGSINKIILNTLITTIVYAVTLLMVVLLPWYVKKRKTTKEEIGLTRLPLWSDILLSPAGLVVYFLIASVLILLATSLLPWFNINEVQNTGFEHMSQQYQYIMAFITLVVVAPFAEEILFRGYLYGKLKKFVPIWVAVLATSLLFGAVHGSWNLAIDTFALSVILCLLREFTGSIWASVLVHMLKNSIAFYILFISPILLTTMVK